MPILLAALAWVSALGLLQHAVVGTPLTGDWPVLRTLAPQATFLALGLGATVLYLRSACASSLRDPRLIGLLVCVTSLSLVLLRLALAAVDRGLLEVFLPEAHVYALPFALAPLLMTLLGTASLGAAAGIWSACVATAMLGFQAAPVVCTALAVLVAASAATRVRARARILRIGLATGCAQAACAVAILMQTPGVQSTEVVLHAVLAALAGGGAIAVLVLLLLPLFESLFRLTTDITLLELSDLGHPLMQRLAIEAPGTYHHSLVVANLSQAAADEIGANGLLARVCSYFHDIGKLTKPEFFAENIRLESSPHDDLSPSMSTLVILSHVKEGVTLALLHKLPPPIIDVIQEHHGTGLVQYFHHKAQTQLELAALPGQAMGRRVDEGQFRYPGPLPRSRESAIISLADGVEGASRSLIKVTPAAIEDLVERIVAARIVDGQLERCRLTFEDVARIKRSFIFTLTNMLHSRVAYPRNENRNKQPAESPAREPGESPGSAAAVPPVRPPAVP